MKQKTCRRLFRNLGIFAASFLRVHTAIACGAGESSTGSGTFGYDAAGSTQAAAISNCQAAAGVDSSLLNASCRSTTPQGLLGTAQITACSVAFFEYSSQQWYANGTSSYDCCITTPPVPSPIFSGPPVIPVMPPVVLTPPVMPNPIIVLVPACPAGQTQAAGPFTDNVSARGNEDYLALATCEQSFQSKLSILESSFQSQYGNNPNAHLVVNKSLCDADTRFYPGVYQPWISKARYSAIVCVGGSSPMPSNSSTPTPTSSNSPSPSP